jgi:hypothetical protein
MFWELEVNLDDANQLANHPKFKAAPKRDFLFYQVIGWLDTPDGEIEIKLKYNAPKNSYLEELP